jgi:hypothetical protein
MATIIKIHRQNKGKAALQREIKKCDKPGCNPEKAIDGMYEL